MLHDLETLFHFHNPKEIAAIQKDSYNGLVGREADIVDLILILRMIGLGWAIVFLSAIEEKYAREARIVIVIDEKAAQELHLQELQRACFGHNFEAVEEFVDWFANGRKTPRERLKLFAPWDTPVIPPPSTPMPSIG